MKHLTADQKGSGALCFSHSAAFSWCPKREECKRGGNMFPTHQREFIVEEFIISPANWGFHWVEAVGATCMLSVHSSGN